MSETVSGGAAHAQVPVQVQAADLPLHCPGSHSPLWSMHPRVFLDIAQTGSVRCPYCSTTYQLAPGTVVHGH
jgi:uncharacterized Zn-finger protein